MAEQLDLLTPVVTSRTGYTLQNMVLDWTGQAITANLLGSDGTPIVLSWTGATAVALLTALNSANLSIKSLQRRLLERAVTDGKLPGGNVSGTPA